MKPEFEDTNNHLPKLTPDDEWADMEGASSKVGHLPPRRGQNELPLGWDAQSLQVNIQSVIPEEDPDRVGDDEENASIIEETEQPGKKVPYSGRNSNDQSRPILAKHTIKKSGSEDERKIEPAHSAESPHLNDQSDQAGEKNKIKIKRYGKEYAKGSIWSKGVARLASHWVLLTGVGVAILVMVFVFWSYKIRKADIKTNNLASQESKVVVEPQVEDDAEVQMLKAFNNSREEAKILYASYLSAKTSADLSNIVFNASGNAPLIEKKWKPMVDGESWKSSDSNSWSPVGDNGKYYGVLTGFGPDYRKFEAYFRMAEDGLKLDWRATTGYSSATYDELANGKGDAGEIRATVSVAAFHTYVLPENQYRSYRILLLNSDLPIWGYARVGSPVESKLSKFFQRSDVTGEQLNEVDITIALERATAKAMPSQWFIKGVLADNWIEQ